MNPIKGHFRIRAETWFPWILITAGLLAYANSFACPFLFDDAVVITGNHHIFHLWPPWKAVLVPTRCLADYSFALNYAWAGFSPAEFRLVNILIHIGAGLLLFGTMRRTLLLPRWNNRFNQTAAGLAFATSLLWIVHPLQTESVTYIAQRIEALMGFFFLLTFYCFVRAFGSARPHGWQVAAIISCALGMATKEVMIVAPVLILLYDGIFISSSWRECRNRWKLHAGLCSTWLVLAGLLVTATVLAKSGNVELSSAGYGDDSTRQILTSQPENSDLFTPHLIRWQYAFTQLNILVHYLKLSLIPSPLCLDYMWPFVQSPMEALWPGSLTILLGLGSLWALWRRSWVGFLGAWFFLILAPTSSFSPLPDAAFEHRMYLPLAGILALLVLAADGALRRLFSVPNIRATVGLALLAIATSIWGGMTLLRNETYLSQERMWRDVIQSRPNNFRTYIALANSLMETEQYQEAASVCSNMLSRLPPFADSPNDTNHPLFSRPGKPPLPLYYAMAHNNLGVIAMSGNKFSEAKHHYQEAITAFPGIYWARRNLGQVLFLENNLDAAINEFQTTLVWRPGDSQTHCFLGLALSRKRAYGEAARHYQEAVNIKPDFWFARTQLAWLLATCPSNEVRDGRQALIEALALLKLTENRSAKVLDIAAAAYAESGDFSNAVSFAQQALDRIRHPSPPGEERSSIRESDIISRLELYQNRMPYRE